jgi:hypothetical protein
MHTLYEETNAEVYPDQVQKAAEPEVEANYYRWLACQQMHYGQLLKVRICRLPAIGCWVRCTDQY